MKNDTKYKARARMVLTALALAMLLTYNLAVSAAPNGASLAYVGNSTASALSPGNWTDAKGTINTVRLSSLQQNTHWKAYVGNVSGKLTLDDANSYTIYDWVTGSTKGEVYASRFSSVSWSTIACVNPANLTAEQSALGISASASDSLQSTFNWSGHKSFDVGTTTMTNCNSTATYMNDTNVGQVASPFHEALLNDGASAFVYATVVNASSSAYRNDSTFDFQMIVADNASAGSPALTYFFWVELI